MASDLRHKLQQVIQAGLALNSTADLQSIVQSATDAGRELCGAQFGAFFYNIVNADGESYRLYTLSGADREAFSRFPQPRNTQVFGPTFEGRETVRSSDITQDPRYGHNPPHHGMPAGHLPVRSYLAVPVKSKSGEVLGGLFYGHERADVFDEDSEDLIAAIASQAAIAIENARLREQLTRTINDLRAADIQRVQSAKRLGELAAIVESSEDAIFSTDLNGIVTSWNRAAARILEYTADEMIGASFLVLIRPRRHAEAMAIFDDIRAGNHIEHLETIRVTKSGKRLDVSVTISPVRDEAGQIIGVSTILRDISTAKRMERSLLQSEKIAAAGRMAATIAHEINNPLEALGNLLYLARDKAADPEQIDYLRAAESEVERVSHVARQTLGFYREHTAVAAVSLADLASHAVRVYQPRCRAAGIQIESRFESSREIVARRGEMMQVISNLIANSIQAMPSGGTLTLAVTEHDSTIELCIEDTGSGIPLDVLPRVFDAFFTTRDTVGTGIGLFVAKQFVEGHGGAIKIESRTDPASHGTRVCVLLPLESPYAAKSEPLFSRETS